MSHGEDVTTFSGLGFAVGVAALVFHPQIHGNRLACVEDFTLKLCCVPLWAGASTTGHSRSSSSNVQAERMSCFDGVGVLVPASVRRVVVTDVVTDHYLVVNGGQI